MAKYVLNSLFPHSCFCSVKVLHFQFTCRKLSSSGDGTPNTSSSRKSAAIPSWAGSFSANDSSLESISSKTLSQASPICFNVSLVSVRLNEIFTYFGLTPHFVAFRGPEKWLFPRSLEILLFVHCSSKRCSSDTASNCILGQWMGHDPESSSEF